MRSQQGRGNPYMIYNPESGQHHYDRYGGREWDRLEDSLQGRIKYAIHRRFLQDYAGPDVRVLEIGCGPGRFASDLVESEAAVTLADISQTQLDLALKHLSDAGLDGRISGCLQRSA